uniref:Uncharacterized protein n=1 Tax=Anguilla anguilla TaxID=7936 RepID=A0A0E9Q398_ANGAN
MLSLLKKSEAVKQAAFQGLVCQTYSILCKLQQR